MKLSDADKVVQTFLPTTIENLENLAGIAAQNANEHGNRAIELRGAKGAKFEWEMADKYADIRDAFRRQIERIEIGEFGFVGLFGDIG